MQSAAATAATRGSPDGPKQHPNSIRMRRVCGLVRGEDEMTGIGVSRPGIMRHGLMDRQARAGRRP